MSVSLIRPRGTSLGVYIPITNYDDGDGDSYSDDDGDDDNEDDNNEDGFWSQLLDLAARSPIFSVTRRYRSDVRHRVSD